MKKFLKLILIVVACYCIALISNVIFLESIVVSGNSMDENLQDGEFGFADKQLYKVTGLHRFDIVILDNEGSKLIKRIIGLPNEKVEYKNGILLINDEVVEENFISPESKLSTNRDEYNINITLGENEYYVLGDNRWGSLDSRNFGPIKREQIDARLFMIIGKCKDNLECDTNSKCLCDKKYFWPRFY